MHVSETHLLLGMINEKNILFCCCYFFISEILDYWKIINANWLNSHIGAMHKNKMAI